MCVVKYSIENTFEAPTEEEWKKYLGSSLFNNMRIDPGSFSVDEEVITRQYFNQGICENIRNHNNKVGALNLSYVLCRHYFDKGIPDDPWYISPGKNGSSIEYMPNFKEVDWLLHYWYSYHCEAVYYKLFSIWDSIVSFINDYYQMNFIDDLRLKGNVMGQLKKTRSDIEVLMKQCLETQVFKDANLYRTKIVHGIAPGEISGFARLSRDVEGEIPDEDDNGNVKTDESGIVIMKKVKHRLCLSMYAGEYTNTSTIMSNIDDFCLFTGEKISRIMALIGQDTFSIKL